MSTARPLPGPALKAGEILGDKAIGAIEAASANAQLAPKTLLDAATGDIDPSRPARSAHR
jgi:hypothetical protein